MKGQREYVGWGALERIGDILEAEGARNAFIVAGKKSYELSGAGKIIEAILGDKEIQYTLYDRVTPNPKGEDLERAAEAFEQAGADIMVAVGGGSALDAAKSVKARYGTALIAVPTTAGTGSEATYYITYYDGRAKKSMGSPETTIPEYAILDASLTASQPRHVAAASAMDALTQSIESYWSTNSTDESRRYARDAMAELFRHAGSAVNEKTRESLEAVQLASNLSGKAINISKTTACHALSYGLTSGFGVPHGQAVCVSLPAFMRYNEGVSDEDSTDSRGAEHVRAALKDISGFLGFSDTEGAAAGVENLIAALGLKTSLSGLGIPEADLPALAQQALESPRMANNPRRVDKEGLLGLLEAIL